MPINNTTNPFSITSSGKKKTSNSGLIAPVSGGSTKLGQGLSINSAGGLGPIAPSNATTAGLLTASLRKPAAPVSTGASTEILPVTSASNTLAQTTTPSPYTSQMNQPTQTSTRGLLSFPGIVGDIAGTSRPSDTQTGLVKGIRDTAYNNRVIAEQARQAAERYGQEIAEVGRIGANSAAGHATTGSLGVGGGNAAIASQTASARMQALADAGNLALSGADRQLAAQSQQADALTSALGGANTQQQLTLGGLGTAAGLAPEALRYDAFGGGIGTLTPQNAINNAVQQLASGTSGLGYTALYDQISSAYGPVIANQLLPAIQRVNPGFNPVTSDAQAAAQQSNVQTQGTAATDIARAGLEQTTRDYVAMTGAAQFAGSQSGAVENILNRTGLNNVSSTDYNRALNTLSSRFSSEDFASLSTALREAQLAYSNLLSTGGSTPTTNDASALATLDINQSAKVIKASIRQLEDAVARRLQAKDSERLQFESNLGGGSAPSAGGGSLYNF